MHSVHETVLASKASSKSLEESQKTRVEPTHSEEAWHFSSEVQADILRLLLTHSEYASLANDWLSPFYFRGNEDQALASLVLSFCSRFSQPPTQGQAETEIQTQPITSLLPSLQETEKRTKKQKEIASSEEIEGRSMLDFKREAEMRLRILGRLAELYQPAELARLNQSYTLEKIREWAKAQAWKKAFAKGIEAFQKGEILKLSAIMEEAERSVPDADDGVRWYFEEAQQRIVRREDGSLLTGKLLPTGILELDRLFRRGGIGPGEICLWLGDKGGGKSTALAQMVRRAIYQRANCILFSFEMSEDQVADRLDAGFTGVDMFSLQQEQEAMIDAFESLSAKFPKALAIKRFPNKGATIKDLDKCLLGLSKQGWKPDLICLDYAGIVRPARARDQRHLEMQEILEDFRGLCVKWNAVGHTANQLNRGNSKKEIAGGDDVAGSYDQLQTADFIIVINSNLEDRANNRVRLWIEKVRDGIDHLEIGPFEIDRSKMVFAKRNNRRIDE